MVGVIYGGGSEFDGVKLKVVELIKLSRAHEAALANPSTCQRFLDTESPFEEIVTRGSQPSLSLQIGNLRRPPDLFNKNFYSKTASEL